MYETLSLHRDNAYSKPIGVVIASKHHNKMLCQSSEMLAFKSMQRMHFLEAFPFLQNPILQNIQITNISNTVQKVVSNIFEINLKINQVEFERGRKKNQLIWSFILKVIAGQSLVKTLFLIKPEKGKRFEGNTLSQQRRRTQDLCAFT